MGPAIFFTGVAFIAIAFVLTVLTNPGYIEGRFEPEAGPLTGGLYALGVLLAAVGGVLWAF